MSNLFKERMQQEQRREKPSSDYSHVFAMDLQSILISQSSFYYNMKVCVYNFTFYNLKNNDGVCYVWHKAEGGLSSNEFTSIICDIIQNKAWVKPNETVILFSDGCTYQNHNHNLANLLLHLATFLNIMIKITFLEPGHTQTEYASMHAVIETRLEI